MVQMISSVDQQVAVGKTVSRSDDRAPGNFGMSVSDRFGDMGRRFANQLEIAQDCVIRHRAGDKRCPVQPGGIVQDPFAEADHVRDVEAPLPLPLVRPQTFTASRIT